MEELKTSSNTSSTVKPASTVKPLEDKEGGKMKKSLVVILLVCGLLGIASGYGIYAWQGGSIGGSKIEVVNTETEEGVKDAATFRDTATGKLIKNDGKITEEGSHILVRGDASQNAYLISTVVDLDKYVGKNVQVWGETYQGQEAGWLMDVGRIKVE